MPQIQVFDCPSCGAHLSYEGGPETTVTCQFCGSTVVIPEEMRAKAAPPPVFPGAQGQGMPPVFPGAQGQAGTFTQAGMAEVEQLARAGQLIQAIKLYRQLTGVGLREAKDAVEAMAAGGGQAVFPGAQGQGAPPDQAALIAILEQLASHAASSSPDKAAKAAAVLRALEQMAAQGALFSGAVGQATNVNQAGMAAVEQLARAGQEIEAIRVYRLLTGAGLRESKDAVEAMMGAGGPSFGPAPVPQYAARPRPARRARRAAGCGCLPVLLLVVAGIFAFSYVPYRVSGSYAKVLSTVRANPDIVRALGEPVEADWWLWGSSISCSGSCYASYTMGVRGTKSSGTVDVKGSMLRGGNFFDADSWTVTGAVTTGGRVYQLAARSPAASSQVTARPTATMAPLAPTPVPAPTEPQPTASPDFQGTAEAISGGQSAWPPTSPVNLSAPFGKWPTGLRQDDAIAVTTTVQAKNYVMTVFPKHSSSYMNFVASDAGPLTDFYAMVDLTFKQGAAGNTYAYGLVFRLVNDDYGFFGLQNDGQFKFLRVRDTGIVEQDIIKSPAIKTGAGQTNQLLVRNVGSDFVFEINGVPVWGFSRDMPAGKVGLGVDVRVKGQPAQVVFSNFEVHAPKP